VSALRQRAAIAATTLVFAGSLTGFALATAPGPAGGSPPDPAVAAVVGDGDERPGGRVVAVGDGGCDRAT
jgi:hypothetical protein